MFSSLFLTVASDAITFRIICNLFLNRIYFLLLPFTIELGLDEHVHSNTISIFFIRTWNTDF